MAKWISYTETGGMVFGVRIDDIRHIYSEDDNVYIRFKDGSLSKVKRDFVSLFDEIQRKDEQDGQVDYVYP